MSTPTEPIAGPSTAVLGPNNSRKRQASDDRGEPSVRNAKRLKPESSAKSVKDKKKRKKKKRKMSIVGASENRPMSAPPSSTLRTTRSITVETETDATQQDFTGPNPISTKISNEQPTPKEMQATPLQTNVNVEKLNNEIEVKSSLVQQHEKALGQVQQSITCQICLDLLYKPYALAPCGHTACHSCLVNWFTSIPPHDGAPAGHRPHTFYYRKKTCPHCRAVVRERPVEVWAIKNIVATLVQSGLLTNIPPEQPQPQTSAANENKDPWHNIFRSSPKFLDTIYGEERPVTDLPVEETGMYDAEDGGIYRCLDCMHEIEDGICSGCNRAYDGHAQLEAQRADTDAFWDDADGSRYFEDLMGMWGNHAALTGDSESESDEEDDDHRRVRRRFHPHGDIDVQELPGDQGGEEEEDYEGSFIDDGNPRRRSGERMEPTEVIELTSDENMSSSDEEDTHHRPVARHQRRPVESDSEDDSSDGSTDEEIEFTYRYRQQTRGPANMNLDSESESEDDGSLPGPPARLRHLFNYDDSDDSD
ncbi:E3 ubiquitin ligase [Marasmius tenuissimus]|uniref:E3 ubiquitin ligase n=1 Tax=Marasmius tenuissimus TaxID=585030 RepID=A0ABR2ZWH0_9AGAR